MVWLVMWAAGHYADEAQSTDMRDFLWIGRGYGEHDTIWNRIGRRAPAVQMRAIDFMSVSYEHPLDRVPRPALSGNCNLEAAVNWCRIGVRVQCHAIHVDEMLAQGFEVDLRPIGLGIGLEYFDDFLVTCSISSDQF